MHIANTTYAQTEGTLMLTNAALGAEKLGMKGTSRNHCNEHTADGRLRDDRLDFLNVVTIWMFPTNYALSPQLDMLLCMRILCDVHDYNAHHYHKLCETSTRNLYIYVLQYTYTIQ